MMKRILTMLLLVLMSWQQPAWGQELYTSETNVTAPAIQVLDVPEDALIRNRLLAVLGAIDGLQDIDVQVTSGVVTLAGEVPSSRLNRDAFAIASHTEGVVYVLNRLSEEADVASRLRPASRKFQKIGADLLRALPVGLVALLVVVLFWFLGQWAGSRGAWLRRAGLSDLAVNLGLRVVRLLVIGIGLLIALEILDAIAVVGALLGVAGIAGIALGFAFRNIAENYLAGVLLSARNPFSIGDQVQIGEFLGKVVRLTSRDTVLMTLDGNHLRIPNSTIITSAMLNFTRNPLRRFEFKVGVSVDLDVAAARDLGMTTLGRINGILPAPGPQVLISELGDSTVQLSFLAWIDQRETDISKARSEAIRLVKAAFDAAGIEMPEPIYRIHLRDAVPLSPGEGGAARPAPAPPPRQAAAMAADSDVTADHTIDKQVADDLRTSDEENLLKKGG
ncbi:MAG: mechanosensitive ion channel family protein [Gammaproteobacteria bacterium]|nr:mechanosensitive ion channel family protein [Gammaproteobacteria bacterium]